MLEKDCNDQREMISSWTLLSADRVLLENFTDDGPSLK